MNNLDQLIEQHLYHRQPNLLLDAVEALDDTSIATSLNLTEDHALLQGHFPGLPIFPGTQMLEMLVQSAGLYMSHLHYPQHRQDQLSVGIFRKCHQATFKHFARPTQRLRCHVQQVERVDQLHEFKGSVSKESGEILMKASFSLTTVPEATLRGQG